MERHVPRPRPAFDGGGVKPVDVERVAQFLEEPQFRLQDGPVGRRHVAGDRVRRFPQPFGKRLVHEAEQRVEPVFVLEKLEHRLRHGPRAVRVVVTEDRQVVHDLLDLHQFGRADRLVRDRHGHHDGDKRILRVEGVIGHRVGPSAASVTGIY
jgi:hypothetical protein